MTVTVPVFTDQVTEISADFANTVSQLVYGVFGAAGTAAGARLAMGLGTLAAQNANAVQIAGGSIDNTPIGFTTPAQARFSVAYLLNTPVDPHHAVNKAYVDGLVQSASGMIVSLEEQYVAKIGSTMTGPLVLSGDPVLQLHAASKRYVDQQITIRLSSTLNSYQALRQYNGSATSVEITAPFISGLFIVDPTDTTSDDNNGTIIVDTQNRRWKREYVDSVAAEWFGAVGDGATEDEAAFAAAAALQYPIALREGAIYQFGSTLTINGGTFVLRNRATIRLAGGVINNTDSSSTHFTPILRLQGMQFVDLGTTIFDQNAANQVYPATLSSFGRGTSPFLHNGSVEITPDVTNTTASVNVHAERATFQNSYLNGLVLWQVVNAWVDESQFLNTGLNGISACGVRNVRLYKNQGFRCGVSAGFPATQYTGNRALISLREFPIGVNFLTEGIPSIVTGVYASGGINQFVEVSENYGEQCSTNTIFVRATLGLTGGRNRSYNVGLGRPVGAPFRAAHFWFEACEGANIDNSGYQDVVQSGDGQPIGMSATALTGNATAAFPMNGNYRLDVRGARLHSAKNSSGTPIAGLLYTGLNASSNVTADYIDIDGTTVDGIDLTNVSTYESPATPPHDASFNNARIVNVGGLPIQILLTGTPTGVVSNVKAENCTVDAGKEPISFNLNVNVSANPPSAVSYSLGPNDWNVTSENVKSSFNTPFWRTATNTATGVAAIAGFEAVGDSGQTLMFGVTSSTYTGGLAPATTAFMGSNASATGGLVLSTAAGALSINSATAINIVATNGSIVTKAGATVASTVYASGRIRFGAAASDDGNLIQLGGTLGIAQYTTATLPAAPNGSPIAFATDGAKQNETFPGTGCLVYFSNGQWRNIYGDVQVNTHTGQLNAYAAGTWDASANHVNGDTNTLLSATAHQTVNVGTTASPVYSSVVATGAIYRVTVAGTTSLDGIANWAVGDLAIAAGGVWNRVAAPAPTDGTAYVQQSGVWTALPTASASVLGAIKVGAGLTMTTGVLSANVQTVAGRTGTVVLTVADVTGAAPLASPAFTGTPTVPTATAGTNTTQAASTAFVTTAVTGLAPLASPAFTGTPTVPTAAPGTNTTQAASTAYVTAAVAASAYTLPTASASVKGGVQVGGGLTMTGTTLSVTGVGQGSISNASTGVISYRYNADGTVEFWGSTTIASGTTSVSVTLPVAVANGWVGWSTADTGGQCFSFGVTPVDNQHIAILAPAYWLNQADGSVIPRPTAGCSWHIIGH